MKSRLKKNHGLNKTASYYTNLHSILLKSGDTITFQTKILANKPWYMIVQDSNYDISSYYDGPDFDRAFRMYVDIIMAFKGIKAAEDVNKLFDDFKKKSQLLLDEKKVYYYKDMYPTLKRNPLFLGGNDF